MNEINRLATITKKLFALGEPIRSSTKFAMYVIIATTDKKWLSCGYKIKISKEFIPIEKSQNHVYFN